MKRTLISLLLASAAFFAGRAVADSSQSAGGVVEVKGRGAEGRQLYDGGGKLSFLGIALDAQVVHYQPGGKIALPLSICYRVLETAPIRLTSRMGTEHWRLYSAATESMTAMYTDERIDLATPGEHTAQATRAWFNDKYGDLPQPGLASIRGHYYFLIEKPEGGWLDITDSPAFFDRREVVRALTFTLADLTRFSVSVAELQSTWESGGPLRLRLVVRDAGDRELPVVNAPLTVSAGDWRANLATQWAPLDTPTGWMECSLPPQVPAEVTVEGTVKLETPGGARQLEVLARFQRGEGRVAPEQLRIAQQGYELPRTDQGVVRETRAMWAGPSDIASAEKIRTAVARCRQAGLNAIVPDIFVRNTFLARSDAMPSSGSEEESLDPLGHLLDTAHRAGLEVHPWFCVTYRDRRFRDWFRAEFGDDIAMIDADGKEIPLGADVHRQAYRDFLIKLMVGVARDYPVDGIHLDYIRTMDRCYCKRCREEFQSQFHKPLVGATDEDWIAWQREAIGDIVRRTAEGVRQARPAAKMSAAVFSSLRGGALQGQDPAGWARQGWIDIVMPMDYQMQSLAVRVNEREFLEALDDDDQLVTGLSLYMRSGTDVNSRPPDLIREQIELVRRMGIHGYCLFALSHLSDEQLAMLREQINAEPAVPYYR
ncbi:MAG: family 10 glycosylhydrolase [Rhodopirellula sp.]|nr:family 10 glycosylhydrolase [Rhodopirellula sp.]